MKDHEQRLSDYIDRLNADQRPEENEFSTDSDELKKLFHTVNLVRTLKEPTMPEKNYPKRLAASVKQKHLSKKARKWPWITGVAGFAAAALLAINLISPIGDKNIVTAMADAFEEVKTYHGNIEIVQTSQDGNATTQASYEVWANHDGNYYIKGLSGYEKDIITVNNGEQKWQIQPNEKEVEVYSAFPDAFAFDLGKEIENVTAALATKVIGEDEVAGRKATIIEVTPDGGLPYKMWIDYKTKLPLQKELAMHNAIQYRVTYTAIDFTETIPTELFTYAVPKGFAEVNEHPEKLVRSLKDVETAIGFTPDVPEEIPSGFTQAQIAIITKNKLSKIYYHSADTDRTVVVIQRVAKEPFEMATNALLGTIGNNIAEIQSPLLDEVGIIGGSAYAHATQLNSIRWQQDGFEYAIIGDVTVETLASFTEELSNLTFDLSTEQPSEKGPEVEVEFDLVIEENDQKSVDAGSSPWKLDPVFVAHVFVNLEMSPGGIVGDYPLSIDEFKVVKNTGNDAIIVVSGDKTPIKYVYLKRVVRQDATGIWTVVGYDPVK